MNLLGLLRTVGHDTAPVSVYVTPHQDDEVTSFGAAMLEEVAAGVQVIVLIVTRGESSGARTNPTLISRLGYTPTVEEFSAARDREFVEAVTRFGATPVVPPYTIRQSDGSASGPAIAALIKGLFPPTVRLRATAPTDYHIDHRACGIAVDLLAAEGWGQDHRHFLAYPRRNLAPAGVTLTQIGPNLGPITEYHTWSYSHVDVPNGWWGIGYLSAEPIFVEYLTVNNASYWHAPLPPPDHALYGTATYDTSVYA